MRKIILMKIGVIKANIKKAMKMDTILTILSTAKKKMTTIATLMILSIAKKKMTMATLMILGTVMMNMIMNIRFLTKS